MSSSYISFTSISTYIECPYKYYLAYVLMEKPLFKEVYEFGKNIHSIIRTYYELIPPDLTPGEIRLYITQALKKLNISPVGLQSILENFASFEEQRLGWHVNAKPIAVEKEYVKEPFRGIVDAVFVDSSNKLVVVDWKTSIKGDLLMWERMRLQANIYMYLTDARRAIFYGLMRGNVEEFEYDEKYLMLRLEEFLKNVGGKKFSRKFGEHCRMCEYNIQCHLRMWGYEKPIDVVYDEVMML